MNWKIELNDSSKKELSKLDKQSQKMIANYLKKILVLKDPKCLGKSLKHNFKGLWRYRISKFRIVCNIQNDQLVILVLKIAKRDIVYED